MTTDHDDQQLLGRLRAADPAVALLPLSTDQLSRILEDTMTANPTTVTNETPTRSRRTPLLIAGGLGVAAAAAGVVALTAGGGGITQLTELPSDPMAMCAMVTPDALAARTLAFEATVTGTDGKTVTLEVTERFKGTVEDEVQIGQQDATAADFSAVQYVAGESYLIAADGGQVAQCGQSGPVSPELADLYNAAYRG